MADTYLVDAFVFGGDFSYDRRLLDFFYNAPVFYFLSILGHN